MTRGLIEKLEACTFDFTHSRKCCAVQNAKSENGEWAIIYYQDAKEIGAEIKSENIITDDSNRKARKMVIIPWIDAAADYITGYPVYVR